MFTFVHRWWIDAIYDQLNTIIERMDDMSEQHDQMVARMNELLINERAQTTAMKSWETFNQGQADEIGRLKADLEAAIAAANVPVESFQDVLDGLELLASETLEQNAVMAARANTPGGPVVGPNEPGPLTTEPVVDEPPFPPEQPGDAGGSTSAKRRSRG